MCSYDTNVCIKQPVSQIIPSQDIYFVQIKNKHCDNNWNNLLVVIYAKIKQIVQISDKKMLFPLNSCKA